MDSETVCECPARTDQVGGSFGLIASDRAVLIKEEELSSMVLAEVRMGSWAREPCQFTKQNMRKKSFRISTLIFKVTSVTHIPQCLAHLSSDRHGLFSLHANNGMFHWPPGHLKWNWNIVNFLPSMQVLHHHLQPDPEGNHATPQWAGRGEGGEGGRLAGGG